MEYSVAANCCGLKIQRYNATVALGKGGGMDETVEVGSVGFIVDENKRWGLGGVERKE